MNTIPENEIIEVLRARTKPPNTQTKAAADLGFSLPYINDVLAKRRPVSAQLAARLGYRRLIVFVEAALAPAPSQEGGE